MDREIELEQGARPPAMAFYRIAPFEVEELQKQLKDLLDTCYIYPSRLHSVYWSIWCTGRLLKEERWLFMNVHRLSALNKITIKNKYLILLITDLLNQLGKHGTLLNSTYGPGTIKYTSLREKSQKRCA